MQRQPLLSNVLLVWHFASDYCYLLFNSLNRLEVVTILTLSLGVMLKHQLEMRAVGIGNLDRNKLSENSDAHPDGMTSFI